MYVYPRRNCCYSYPWSTWKISEILCVFLFDGKRAPSVHELPLIAGFDRVHVDKDVWLWRPVQDRTAPESRFFYKLCRCVFIEEVFSTSVIPAPMTFRYCIESSRENMLTILYCRHRTSLILYNNMDKWGSSWRIVRIKSVDNRICPILKLILNINSLHFLFIIFNNLNTMLFKY